MKRKIIDISTEEKKKDVFDKFNSFTSKNQAHEYFGISDNKEGSEYLKEIARSVGFDINLYKTKKKKPIRYCKKCGKEINSKWGKVFCSSACAAKYNNEHRDKTVYENVASKLRKEEQNKEKIVRIKKNGLKYIKFCTICGKKFETFSKNTKHCSDKCIAEDRHRESYKDFLENNEKYCRANYTPKNFKKEFLKEQDNVCAICGCKPEHNGKPLVFILDHIDGDASNNKRENLRMICPNCDSQLDTFKSKNKNSTRRNYWREHILNNLVNHNNVVCQQ